MENFKLSKTGIIIIVVSAVIVVLLCAIFYIAGKKTAEIKQETDKNNAIGEPKVEEGMACCDDDEQYYPIFEDYRAGKYNSKQGIEKSGLSCGMFYKKLKLYENT